MLVEDNEDDIELTRLALADSRVANRLEILRDGEQALDYLLSQNQFKGRTHESDPALVLLDLKLPKIDGIEVLRAIRTEAKLKYLPVVILTTSNEDRDKVESYKLGANSYICKPVDFSQFNDVVKQLSLYWIVINKVPQVRR